MKFGEYVDILLSTESFKGDSRVQLGTELFKAAGPKHGFSESSMQKWLTDGENSRNCKVERYFPDGVVQGGQFVDYLRRKMRDPDSWKAVQKAFSKWKTDHPDDESFRVDTETGDHDVFYCSLLNQFQRIFRLPESDLNELYQMLSLTEKSQIISAKQLRNIFLMLVRHYKIMKIINKNPPVLTWDDSARLNVFLRHMDHLGIGRAPRDNVLCVAIKTFTYALCIEAMSLTRGLSRISDPEDENASVNMSNWDSPENKASKLKFVEYTPERIASLICFGYEVDDEDDDVGNDDDVDDGDDEDDVDNDGDDVNDDEDIVAKVLHILHYRVEEWEHFRNEMNFLLEDISSWQDEA